MTDLGITLAHCQFHLSHTLERVLDAIAWISVSILMVFILEFIALVSLFGRAWLHIWVHWLDISVVVVSFIMELVLRSSALKEVVALLVVFRLWRLIRIVHATEEILHLEHENKSARVEARIQDLKRQLAERDAQVQEMNAQLNELHHRLQVQAQQ
eukprot:jgi/Chrzof1/603/Cz01g22030.t1